MDVNPLITIRKQTLPLNTIDCDLENAASASLEDLQSITWDRVRIATSSDNLTRLIDMLEDGRLQQSFEDWPPNFREYHQFRDHLYTINGVLMYKNRIVCHDCIQALHAAHQGISSMTARAGCSIFLPGITYAIAHIRTQCEHCNRIAPSQPNAPPATHRTTVSLPMCVRRLLPI